MNDMIEYLSETLTPSDVYFAKATGAMAALVHKHRKALNMSQKEFAKFMGVTQTMISMWESAEHNFTLKTIAKIAEKLNMKFEIELNEED